MNVETESDLKLYWSLLHFGKWNLIMVASSRGLCCADVYDKSVAPPERWVARQFPGKVPIRGDERLRRCKSEFVEYFQGSRTEFTFPLDLRGTPFRLAVWKALLDVPYGATRSYSDIAERLQKPGAARAIGAAIGANPVLIVVPCHRVIGKDGSLTGYRCGLEMKQRLLQLEQGHIQPVSSQTVG